MFTRKERYTAWVDVYEAWFFTVNLHGRVKIAPGQQAPKLFCKSKRNIPKVMFLAAAARPRPGFDGRIGLWRVCKSKEAQRPSKNHDEGDVYEVADTMTAAKYYEMMTKKVFPAIQKAFRGTGVKKIIVQQDGGQAAYWQG